MEAFILVEEQDWYWFNVKLMTALYHTVEPDPNILTLRFVGQKLFNGAPCI